MWALRKSRAVTPKIEKHIPGKERRNISKLEFVGAEVGECVGTYVGAEVDTNTRAVLLGNAVGSKYVTDLIWCFKIK